MARILDGRLGAAFTFVLSEALLAEYRAVLVRLRLCKLHGLSETEIDVLSCYCFSSCLRTLYGGYSLL